MRPPHVCSAVIATASAAAISTLIGCATNPSPRPVPPGAVSTLQVPAPDARGPTVIIDGTTTWDTGHPGCVLIALDGGQTFQLTGPAVTGHLAQVRAGAAAATSRMRITGHIPPVGATVCGPVHSFVAEQISTPDG